jgi:hypothetical protein
LEFGSYSVLSTYAVCLVQLSIWRQENLNSPIVALSSIVAAAGHDVGHVGRTNNFLYATHDSLAVRYFYK